MNALDPKIDKGPWTPQQDRKLLENIDKFGKGEDEHCVTFQESTLKVAPLQFFENSKKMVIFTIVCCHGNSLQHTDMQKNRNSLTSFLSMICQVGEKLS